MGPPCEDFLGPVEFIFPDSWKGLFKGTWAFLLRHIMILPAELPNESERLRTETKILASPGGKCPNSEAGRALTSPMNTLQPSKSSHKRGPDLQEFAEKSTYCRAENPEKVSPAPKT